MSMLIIIFFAKLGDISIKNSVWCCNLLIYEFIYTVKHQ